MSNSSFQAFPTPEVWAVIEKLKQGSWLKVSWHDASSFSRVRVITPDIYVTRKATAGYFYGCRKDPNGDMHYLILYTEETDGSPTEGTSIPVGCVEAIQVEFPTKHGQAAVKVPRKAWKTQAPIKIVEVVKKIIVEE